MHVTLKSAQAGLRRFALVVSASLALIVGLMTVPAMASGVGGNQWIAKQYTEVLGRAPDSSGWGHYVSAVYGSNCTQANLSANGQSFFGSTEFQGLGYTNAQKVEALYRAILNRDPDQSGFNAQLNALNSGTPITTVAANMYSSSEFASLVGRICNNAPYYWGNASFGSNANSAIAFGHEADGQFSGGTAAQLQAALDNAASGCGTVYLDRGAVITADTTITVPGCVTLATYGMTNRNAYLQMARIIRTGNFENPVLALNAGSTLSYVWVDGNRNGLMQEQSAVPGALDYTTQYSGWTTGNPCTTTNPSSYQSAPTDLDRACMMNVQVQGSNVTVENSRIQDPLGGTNLKVLQGNTNETITNNLFVGYATSNYLGETTSANLWADGITFDGGSSSISGNDIVDPTDVGVVLFPFTPDTNTVVQNNNIRNLGNSAFAAVTFDPWYSSPYPQGYDYSGTDVKNNTVFTSLTAHYHIAFGLGTRAWFGQQGNWVTNGAFESNVVPSGRIIRTGIGIGVDDAQNILVLNNTLNLTLESQWLGCGLATSKIDVANDGSYEYAGSTPPDGLENLYSGSSGCLGPNLKQSQVSSSSY